MLEIATSTASRRHFLKSFGGGVLVLFTLEKLDAQESGHSGHHREHEQLPPDVAAWLHIPGTGEINVFTGKVEVGQNIRTSLTQAVADELRCSPRLITLLMGDTAHTPWDMGTFGSRTTPTMAPILRTMAGTARETLAQSAIAQWNVARNQVDIVDACVINRATGARLSFAELAGKVDWVKIIGREDCVTSPDKWIIAGKSLPKIHARKLVTGEHQYPSDYKLAGMLYGKVLRPPSFGAKLKSVDTNAASQMNGVIVAHDGDFVGVAAPNEALAQKAIESIKAEWEQSPQISAKELFSYIKAQSGSPPALIAETPGVKTLNSAYTVAYIAHTPLEPRAAVAKWNDGDLTVWTGTQRPFGVRQELAQAFGLPEQKVRVLMPDMGSAYGGKHSGECAVETARIAKVAGKPVKLIWTREEEFTWAYLRPAGVINVGSSATAGGKLVQWEFHNYMSGPSGIESPYECSRKNEQFHEVKSPLREGSYRGLAATANHFARESHIDELASAVGMDPLAFRLKNLKNERVLAVLQTAADRFGWSKKKSTPNIGYGLACGTEKGGYVACCVQVSINAGNVHVDHVIEAWDSGAVVNPEHLKNQVEGAIVMGLGGALFEAIDFANGRILNDRLSKYRVPRFSDIPKIEAVLIDRKDVPSAGAGEIPIVGIEPAIANGIFSATGKRIRSMPMLPSLQA